MYEYVHDKNRVSLCVVHVTWCSATSIDLTHLQPTAHTAVREDGGYIVNELGDLHKEDHTDVPGILLDT